MMPLIARFVEFGRDISSAVSLQRDERRLVDRAFRVLTEMRVQGEYYLQDNLPNFEAEDTATVVSY